MSSIQNILEDIVSRKKEEQVVAQCPDDMLERAETFIRDNVLQHYKVQNVRACINSIYRYFGQYLAYKKTHDVKFKPRTGLILIGKSGTGKTLLLQTMQKHKIIPSFYSMADVAMSYETNGFDGLLNHNRSLFEGDCTIDDLGFVADRKRFGNGDLTAVLIDWRYRLWQRSGALTFITTNMATPEMFSDTYGVAIADRIFEMCSVVVFDGTILRKKAGVL